MYSYYVTYVYPQFVIDPLIGISMVLMAFLGGTGTVLEAIAARIRDLNASGTTFLIVEHDMGFVMGLCSTVLVRDRGRTIACGTPAEVRAAPAVLDAYLGV